MSGMVQKDFDYLTMSPVEAANLKARAERIAARERRIIADVLANGQDFAEAREELRHNKAGGFEAWVEHHGWSRRTAYNYIAAWEAFGNCAMIAQLQIDPTAIYLLAAPSTPESAREEAIERAEAGEPITHGTAKVIVQQHRYPHSEQLRRWLDRVVSETLVIQHDAGGIGGLLAEPEKWRLADVKEHILPMLKAHGRTISQYVKEIEDAFEV